MTRISGGGGGGGGKGGGSKSYTPKTAGDNLESTQYAQILDLISEGEIQGLKDGHKSIFFNNTPLQNPDGTYNFKDVTVVTRNGTQSQDYIPGNDAVEDERSVGVAIRNDTPIVRTISDTNVDAVRVTLTFPQFQSFTNKGDIVGTSVDIAIAVQYNGGGFSTVISDTVTGRSGDQYQRDYLINLNGAFPVEIKVSRVSPDSDNSLTTNEFNWSSYTEIVYAKLRYPNSALVSLRVDAKQFSSIPTRSYLVRGIKVLIPSNATVDNATGRLIYSGFWDGTFSAAQWCSDPAWILWDLMTSSRYGLGDHVAANQLDKWAFYAASQYSSALVPDGFGGFEPRFSCNVNIQTAEEAFKVINDMCSVFRAMPYWSTGSLTVSQDKPADPAYLFTLANVSEEGFNYQGSSRKTRPTVAVVSYLNLSTREIDYEVVEDHEAISKYGVVTTQVSAFACTSRGQASRIGEWLLYSEAYENEVVSFLASIDAGVLVRPGQIIEISDPMRAGSRRGGRIRSATTTSVTVDDATGLTFQSGAELSVVLPNGTLETKAVTNISGNTFQVAVAFSAAPNPNSVWVYQTPGLQTSTWRVLSVQEQEGTNYAINAIAYSASKYDYIERGMPLQVRDTTDLNIILPAPNNLQATEALYESNGNAFAKLVLRWEAVTGAVGYRIRYRPEDGNWLTVNVEAADYEILETTLGVYEIEVYSVNSALRQSTEPSLLYVQAFGKTAPPVSVSNVSLVAIDEASAIISWERSTELDVILGGKVLIRHNVNLVGAVWEESQEIVASAAGNQTQKQVPLLEGTYLLKFEDDGGRRSLSATTIVVDLPEPQPRLLLQTYAEEQESPPFSGNYTNMVRITDLPEFPGSSGILIASGITVDEMAQDDDWDGLASIDSIGGVQPSAEYEFGSTYSLPAVFDVNLRRRIVALPYIPGDFWDDKTELIDSWDLIDGTGGDRVNALTYVRTTEDDPSGTPTWSTWREFSNAIIRGRGFQFKLLATSHDPSQNIFITELGADLELQQRTASAGPLASGAGAYGVTFDAPFYQTPSIGITAYNMGTGDYYAITNMSRTGFTVTFYNNSAAAVNRSFTYTAIGFGKEV